MAKKTTGTSNDVYTAMLAISFLAVLAAVVFVAMRGIAFFGGTEALFKIVDIR